MYFYAHDVTGRVIAGWYSNKNPRKTKSDGNCRPNRQDSRLEVGWYYIPGFYCLLNDIQDSLSLLIFVISIYLGFLYRQFVATIFVALLRGSLVAFVESKWVIFQMKFGKSRWKSWTSNESVLSARSRLYLLNWSEEKFVRGLSSYVGVSLARVHGSRKDRLLFADRAINGRSALS